MRGTLDHLLKVLVMRDETTLSSSKKVQPPTQHTIQCLPYGSFLATE